MKTTVERIAKHNARPGAPECEISFAPAESWTTVFASQLIGTTLASTSPHAGALGARRHEKELIMRNSRIVEPDRASSILAKSIFKELKSNGYSKDQVLSLAGELIGLVTTELGNVPAESSL